MIQKIIKNAPILDFLAKLVSNFFFRFDNADPFLMTETN